MGTVIISRGKAVVGRLKLSPSTQIKKSWSYTSNPPIRHRGVERDNFTFTHFIIQTVLKILDNAINYENSNYICKIFTLLIQKFNF